MEESRLLCCNMCALRLKDKLIFSRVGGEIIHGQAAINTLMSTQRFSRLNGNFIKCIKNVHVCQDLFSGISYFSNILDLETES